MAEKKKKISQVLADVDGTLVTEQKVLMGLGEDGHIISFLPGEPVLKQRKHWVAAVSHGRPEIRITMTYPVFASSHLVAFLVSGAAKSAIFREIRGGNSHVPAVEVSSVGDPIWFVDRAAAGEA